MAKRSAKAKAGAKSGTKAVRRARRAAIRPSEPHEDDHVDGCDVEIHEADATPDDELPPARGGVESVGRRR
jgi:hypothetical protein